MDSTLLTGQTVVSLEIVVVTTGTVLLATGQFVTVDAHLKIVMVEVYFIVAVVIEEASGAGTGTEPAMC